jgi:hypothetical protein
LACPCPSSRPPARIATHPTDPTRARVGACRRSRTHPYPRLGRPDCPSPCRRWGPGVGAPSFPPPQRADRASGTFG